MTTHNAEVLWFRAGRKFVDNQYSRSHVLRFDGGIDVPASASPHIVPMPLSAAAAVDPEEAFIASLASCHMLWFLSIAAERGFVVDAYHDAAEGVLAMDDRARTMMKTVTLRPWARFSGQSVPTEAVLADLHHQAHTACFIANSVKTEVRCEPTMAVAP